jgi:hypothetical protein
MTIPTLRRLKGRSQIQGLHSELQNCLRYTVRLYLNQSINKSLEDFTISHMTEKTIRYWDSKQRVKENKNFLKL